MVVSACMKVAARDRVLYRALQYHVERMIAAHEMCVPCSDAQCDAGSCIEGREYLIEAAII
jgi:hypothetical protein